ncbi:MAG TPA: hypothetical protein VHO48_12695 [Anaerolineaceae bacterium]|nr:hypothetical protein [Anaerolineaceae bacterium]
MRLEPPEKVSQEQITLDVREIEPMLQAPPMGLKPWPGAMITLKDGRTMYIRELRLEEIPAMIEYMKKVMLVERDFYDIVGVRVYAELLGTLRKRLKDPFNLVGLVDGVLTGYANGRVMNEDIAISLHTMTFARRGRIGYAMYYAKTFYALETLGCNEWWSTFESYNGWRMAGLEMAQPTKPWPEYQHELGGARIYYVTKKYWDSSLKDFTQQMMGSPMLFDVPDEIIKANETLIIPEDVTL